jgi:hypothetical protein
LGEFRAHAVWCVFLVPVDGDLIRMAMMVVLAEQKASIVDQNMSYKTPPLLVLKPPPFRKPILDRLPGYAKITQMDLLK